VRVECTKNTSSGIVVRARAPTRVDEPRDVHESRKPTKNCPRSTGQTRSCTSATQSQIHENTREVSTRGGRYMCETSKKKGGRDFFLCLPTVQERASRAPASSRLLFGHTEGSSRTYPRRDRSSHGRDTWPAFRWHRSNSRVAEPTR
jgi:hypothetical protein